MEGALSPSKSTLIVTRVFFLESECKKIVMNINKTEFLNFGNGKMFDGMNG